LRALRQIKLAMTRSSANSSFSRRCIGSSRSSKFASGRSSSGALQLVDLPISRQHKGSGVSAPFLYHACTDAGSRQAAQVDDLSHRLGKAFRPIADTTVLHTPGLRREKLRRAHPVAASPTGEYRLCNHLANCLRIGNRRSIGERSNADTAVAGCPQDAVR